MQIMPRPANVLGPGATWRKQLVFALCLACLSGCASSLEEIDAHIAKIVADRSIHISSDANPPQMDQTPEPTGKPVTDKRPETRDLAHSEMKYVPADENRDVEARLRMFAESELGAGWDFGESSADPNAPRPIELDIEGVFRTSQDFAREFKSAEEEYILAAIRLLIEKHRWSPRLFNDTSLVATGSGDNGDYDSALDVVNDLRVTQRLPYGGEAEARWVYNATEQLRNAVGDRFTNSSELILGANIPLLRNAGLIAQEELIQSERNLVYSARDFERFRRSFLVDIASDYFAILELQSRIRSQLRRLQSLELADAGNEARMQAGRLSAYKRNITANEVLQARADLAGLFDAYILQVDRFKVRLGMNIDLPLKILPIEMSFPEPDVNLAEATSLALSYRLDLQNLRDRLDDSRRAVANARNQLLPELRIGGEVGLPTDKGQNSPGLEFDENDVNYRGTVTFGLPLDREIERLNLRQSIISLGQDEREYETFRDNVVISVRASVRAIDRARFQLTLAEEGVKIAVLRREEQELKADTVDPRDIVDAENALVEARNARDRALTELRNAVLNYLLETDQLRVNRDGTFLPPPGMIARPPAAIQPGEAPDPTFPQQRERVPGEDQPAPDPEAPPPDLPK